MLSVKSIGALLAAATFGTALLTVTAAPAVAQAGYHGGWGGGTRYVNRGAYGYRGGYVARGVVTRGYGYRGAYVARGYGYRGYGYRRGWNTGGAVAAGVVGGLALGAVAASASSYPAYGYGSAYGSGYGYAPAYSYAAPSYGYAAPTYGYAAQTYYAPAAVATNACGYVQRRAWIEGEGWRRFTRYECDY